MRFKTVDLTSWTNNNSNVFASSGMFSFSVKISFSSEWALILLSFVCFVIFFLNWTFEYCVLVTVETEFSHSSEIAGFCLLRATTFHSWAFQTNFGHVYLVLYVVIEVSVQLSLQLASDLIKISLNVWLPKGGKIETSTTLLNALETISACGYWNSGHQAPPPQ